MSYFLLKLIKLRLGLMESKVPVGLNKLSLDPDEDQMEECFKTRWGKGNLLPYRVTKTYEFIGEQVKVSKKCWAAIESYGVFDPVAVKMANDFNDVVWAGHDLVPVELPSLAEKCLIEESSPVIGTVQKVIADLSRRIGESKSDYKSV